MTRETRRLCGAGGELVQHLTFVVAETTYAIPLARVREVVPLSPRRSATTLDYRGTAMPLVDLVGRLGAAAGAPPPDSLVLVIGVAANTGGVLFGVVADEVRGVVAVRTADMTPLTRGGADAALESARLLRRGAGIALVLDVDAAAANRLPRALRGELMQ